MQINKILMFKNRSEETCIDISVHAKRSDNLREVCNFYQIKIMIYRILFASRAN